MFEDSKIKTSVILLLFAPAIAFANSEDNSEEEYDFDWSAVGQEMGVKIDRNSFNALHKQMLMGSHTYDIYVNNQFLCQETVEISSAKDALIASVPVKVLHRLSLKDEYLERIYSMEQGAKVSTLQHLLPGSEIQLNEDAGTVNLSIPQIYQLDGDRKLAHPRLWNYGIPAVRLNYDLDVSKSHYKHVSTERGFFSYDTQVNLGEWRFYARGNVSKESEGSTDSDTWDRHAERVIPSLRGKMKVGEFNTTDRYLPSLPIIGVNIYEDDDQLEYRERSYLPVISGFATTQALVTVRQNGRILKEVEVAPGPFEFNNILEVSNSGNIELEIKEKNGKVSSYIIPYAGNSKLLTPGRLTWSGAVGRYDDGYHSEHPWVGQASVGYGFRNGFTLYGGATYSEDFSQGLLGAAVDGGDWGSFSFQVENTHAEVNGNRDGNVAEIGWYKYFEKTESSFDLRYRRTFEGNISSIASVIGQSDDYWNKHDLQPEDFIRDEVTLALSQTIASSCVLSGSIYYSQSDQGNETRSLYTSLSFPMGRMHGTLQAQSSNYDIDGRQDDDWQVSFRVMIPLNMIFPESTIPYSSVSFSRVQGEGGYWGNQFNFSSTFGKYSDWGMNLNVRNDKRDDAYHAGLTYDGAKATLSLSAGRANKTNTVSAHLSGGVIGTEYGVDFSSNTYGGSVALINVPDVDGARTYASGMDSRGEWQVSYALEDYARNTLRLDPDSIPANVYMISGFEQDVIPADGAVIPMIFETFVGHQAVFTVMDENGMQVPYSSLASVADVPAGVEPSIVDELGQAYFSAIPDEGWLEVKWTENDAINSCKTKYSLQEKNKTNGIYIDTLTCKK